MRGWRSPAWSDLMLAFFKPILEASSISDISQSQMMVAVAKTPKNKASHPQATESIKYEPSSHSTVPAQPKVATNALS
ncbi:uncharacterized protein BDV14DRAFT_133515 [Aspergillus stella-maris]|uniref:uncharacterized protein n=1 Tax=Aspergillus stella-maris TaxID=1810926 RepID=UPI003CCD08EE